MSVDNKEDYEKIRFLSLINTRLGELFYSENYCNIATSKYKKALKYNILLKEKHPVAINYKCLGNSYQLYNMPDSALYYYNKSLETSSDLTNRLDVEKCIAQILFDKGEKDSAYALIKKNMGEINNENIRCSYYVTLGRMYREDKLYDSAIYYYEVCMSSNNINTKLTSAINLSSIYDTIGDMQKRSVYDNILSNLFIKKVKVLLQRIIFKVFTTIIKKENMKEKK